MAMFGSSEVFFYRDLGGIGLGGPGFKQITIKPCPVGDLSYVKASLKTVRGPVAVDWKRGDKSLEMQVVLPVNSRAKVSVPTLGLDGVAITESAKTVWKNGSYVRGVAGITGGAESADYVTFDAGSGSYRFKLTGTPKRPR
jgi:alpha-L-rhamnosidase